VRRYLETGEEDIRAAARAAAGAATWDAAGDAAWAAAGDAAWGAARAAAGDEKWTEFNSLLESMIREAAGNPDDDALLAAAEARQ